MPDLRDISEIQTVGDKKRSIFKGRKENKRWLNREILEFIGLVAEGTRAKKGAIANQQVARN